MCRLLLQDGECLTIQILGVHFLFSEDPDQCSTLGPHGTIQLGPQITVGASVIVGDMEMVGTHTIMAGITARDMECITLTATAGILTALLGAGTTDGVLPIIMDGRTLEHLILDQALQIQP